MDPQLPEVFGGGKGETEEVESVYLQRDGTVTRVLYLDQKDHLEVGSYPCVEGEDQSLTVFHLTRDVPGTE